MCKIIRPGYRCKSEKEVAPHSSTLAWKIPWAEEPGRLQSMGSHRVRHDWGTSLSLFTFMYWRRKWQCSCLENPRDGGSLVGCRLWGRTESDMTEVTQQHRCKYRHVYMPRVCVAQVENKCLTMFWCNLQRCSLDGLDYGRLPLSKRTSQWDISFCSGS